MRELIIELNTQVGEKIYKAGIEPLSIQFDWIRAKLQLFPYQFRDKWVRYAWTRILSISNTGYVQYTIDLFESYEGELHQQVKEHAHAYIREDS